MAIPRWQLWRRLREARRVERDLKELRDALDTVLAELPRIDPDELEREVSGDIPLEHSPTEPY